VVKGVSFANLRDAGDPVELAVQYDHEGADELVLLDISASVQGRKTRIEIVRQTAARLSIPFTVGGGISTVADITELLRAGADKISINTAALLRPNLIEEGARKFGSQCIVVAIDAKYDSEQQDWFVYTHGGRNKTAWRVLAWAKEVMQRGAGEILLTSMDQDGRKDGFDLPLNQLISEEVHLPVIASGGAGDEQHFVDLFKETGVSAALAASIFHFKEVTISRVKSQLRRQGVEVR
jgi:imidazole glycerol-phosphate synthase subunit HisF